MVYLLCYIHITQTRSLLPRFLLAFLLIWFGLVRWLYRSSLICHLLFVFFFVYIPSVCLITHPRAHSPYPFTRYPLSPVCHHTHIPLLHITNRATPVPSPVHLRPCIHFLTQGFSCLFCDLRSTTSLLHCLLSSLSLLLSLCLSVSVLSAHDNPVLRLSLCSRESVIMFSSCVLLLFFSCSYTYIYTLVRTYR